MTTHDRITLGGAASLAMPMIALFAWLRDDVRDGRERLARIDGELSGLAKWLQGIFVFGAPRQNALRPPPADPGAGAQGR